MICWYQVMAFVHNNINVAPFKAFSSAIFSPKSVKFADRFTNAPIWIDKLIIKGGATNSFDIIAPILWMHRFKPFEPHKVGSLLYDVRVVAIASPIYRTNIV